MVLCSTKMAKKIYTSYNSWKNHEKQELFGTTGKFNLGRHFFLRQRSWKAEFSCPSLSTMRGDSWNCSSQQDAIEQSIADYIKQGFLHGFLTKNLLQQQHEKLRG
ncbi:unnamed protein product [Rotaria sp. Silwood1]|nr:unnamed protein product [Rotaria sp. Silwood1]